MNSHILGTWIWLLVTPAPIEAKFEQLSPPSAVTLNERTFPRRRSNINRAVILFHGLRIQPISAEAARRAEASFWEMPEAPLVQTLTKDSDVFGFHYAQTSPVDEVARHAALARAVQSLREAGYSELVMVGYSSGGIIARQFVEDHPNAGVTKVVQVSTPNAGSDWTFLSQGVRAAQIPFVESLKRTNRMAIARQRRECRIPESVEFVCLVAVSDWMSDGIVRRDSQWPSDLQSQGIPAEILHFRTHLGAMHSKRLVGKVAELIERPQPRWTPDQVKSARMQVLGILALGKSK